MASSGEEQEPALRERIAELEDEVLTLQRKLGDLHSGDYNALRRAYVSLCQHVSALEEEARGMLAQLQDFETTPVPSELVAKELGVAGLVTFGVALLNTTLRSLPFKTPSAMGKGLALVGGAYVLARLTGGALAHIAGLFGRNASRKRRLMRKLQAVEERIHIMASLQHWAEQQAAGAALAAAPGAGDAPPALLPPPPRVSPPASAGSESSAEMVEMPVAEELEAAEAAEAGLLGGDPPAGGAPAPRPGSAAGSSSGGGAGGARGGGVGRTGSGSSSSLGVLLAYAELGRKK